MLYAAVSKRLHVSTTRCQHSDHCGTWHLLVNWQ